MQEKAILQEASAFLSLQGADTLYSWSCPFKWFSSSLAACLYSSNPFVDNRCVRFFSRTKSSSLAKHLWSFSVSAIMAQLVAISFFLIPEGIFAYPAFPVSSLSSKNYVLVYKEKCYKDVTYNALSINSHSANLALIFCIPRTASLFPSCLRQVLSTENLLPSTTATILSCCFARQCRTCKCSFFWRSYASSLAETSTATVCGFDNENWLDLIRGFFNLSIVTVHGGSQNLNDPDDFIGIQSDEKQTDSKREKLKAEILPANDNRFPATPLSSRESRLTVFPSLTLHGAPPFGPFRKRRGHFMIFFKLWRKWSISLTLDSHQQLQVHNERNFFL